MWRNLIAATAVNATNAKNNVKTATDGTAITTHPRLFQRLVIYYLERPPLDMPGASPASYDLFGRAWDVVLGGTVIG
jgi:hypothetical protein